MSGALKKMEIFSYSDEKFQTLEEKFAATLNPDSYSQKYQVKYAEEQSSGTSGMQLKFDKIEPQTMEFEYIFDQTGALEGTESTEKGVENDIDAFKSLTLGYDGNIHRTRYLILVWGTLLFKCCLENLDVTYKLFKPDGTPLRATVKASFKEFKEDERRVAEENSSSPDLIHRRQMKSGDHLPLMVHCIYGDKKFYPQVARFNDLTSFRNIEEGEYIALPPIRKSTV
jgi:hypothetical protein